MTGLEEVVVMDLDETRFFFACQGGPRRPMGFVTDDDVENPRLGTRRS